MSIAIRILRYVAAFVLAAAVTYVLAATFYTQSIMGELQSTGFDAPIGVRISESLRNIGGMAEKVSDGRDGLHFRTGDPVALAETLLRAAE